MSENMKPSGIDWIGNIPESWVIGRIQHNYEVILGKMVTPEQESTDQTLENYLCAANIRWNGVDIGINKQMWCSSKEKGQYLLKKGDVLIMEGGSIGTTSVYNGEFEPCYIQNSVHCCRGIKSNNTKLLYYWMYLTYNSGYLDVVCNKATIAHYTKEKVCKTPLVLISPEEQDLIVDFLDEQCEKIDSIAIDIEKQIEILQKYKKSLITEKTYSNSLDWVKTKIKYIGEIRGRIGFRGYTVEDTVDPDTEGCAVVLGGTNIMKDGTTNYEDLTFLSEMKYFESPEIMLIGGEILITKVGAGTGENSMYDGRFERATINPNIMLYLPNDNINSKFINYVLLSNRIKDDMKVESTKSGAQPAINQGYINNLEVVIPPYDKQTQIANYLDVQCSKIDAIIESKKEQLTKITQHKKSLIYEYVTGKKRVKGEHSNGN